MYEGTYYTGGLNQKLYGQSYDGPPFGVERARSGTVAERVGLRIVLLLLPVDLLRKLEREDVRMILVAPHELNKSWLFSCLVPLTLSAIGHS